MYPIKWTEAAFLDLQRLYEFLVPLNPIAVGKAIETITGTPEKLANNLRLGERLLEFSPREVRRLVIGRYELRYEIRSNTIYLLRLQHTREDR